MKTTCFLTFAAWFLLALPACADPKTEVVEAIKKLEDESGYAWTSTPKTEGSTSGRSQRAVEGQTEKNGFTLFKGSAGDTAFEVAFKEEKFAVNYNDAWLSSAEVGENSSVARRLRALKTPVDEAGQLVKQTGELKRDPDGRYAGHLAPDAAKELFAFLGRRAAEAPEAKGIVEFWVKDGRLTKYVFTVSGTIKVGEEKREVEISRTTTVEIRDVGSTKVSLPEAVKEKLS
jgi:hypothetical protein